MNIFQFLGKPSDYRTEKKVVQLVKHFDDVNPKAEQDIFHKKVTFPMIGQVKKDGVFAALVIRSDNEVAIFNRTGKRMTNMEHIESYYKCAAENGAIDAGVYFGEALSIGYSLEQVSGAINPNRVKTLERKYDCGDGTFIDQLLLKNRIDIYFFDTVTICEFISGHSARGFKERYDDLCVEMTDLGHIIVTHIIHDEEHLRRFAKYYIDRGEEGAVFKQDVEWKAGAKDWHQMKIVRGVSYDLVCVGTEEGTGKYTGKVANLLLRWKDGKTIKAMLGKGWTHADAHYMYHCVNYGKMVGMIEHEHKDSPVGKIFEVYALQESSKGVLRLPKVGELRHDKSEADI